MVMLDNSDLDGDEDTHELQGPMSSWSCGASGMSGYVLEWEMEGCLCCAIVG